MRYSKGLLSGMLILCLAVFLLAGCLPKLEDEPSQRNDATPAQQVSQAKSKLQMLQAEYDKLSANYEDVKSELETTQAKYDELGTNYEDVKSELETTQAKYDELNAKYEDLRAKHDELSAKYDILIQGTAGISEEDVEQAIFELINQERQNNGLNELEWYYGLHIIAKEHSQYMATIGRLENSEYSIWQGVFRATGYSTLDRMTNATLIIWKESIHYERNFLHEKAKYGAVGVAKSGEVFYITYFADIYGG